MTDPTRGPSDQDPDVTRPLDPAQQQPAVPTTGGPYVEGQQPPFPSQPPAQGQYPQGSYPPAQFPEGQFPDAQPAAAPQGQYPPGQPPFPGQPAAPQGQPPVQGQPPAPGQFPQGQPPQGQYPTAPVPEQGQPAAAPPGQFPQGQYPQAQYPQAQYPPAQFPEAQPPATEAQPPVMPAQPPVGQDATGQFAPDPSATVPYPQTPPATYPGPAAPTGPVQQFDPTQPAPVFGAPAPAGVQQQPAAAQPGVPQQPQQGVPHDPMAAQAGPWQQAPTAAKPAKRGRGKWIALGVTAFVVVGGVIGGFLVVNSINESSHGPDTAVREYFDLLDKGRAEDAVALLPNKLTDADRLLVNDEVYQAIAARPRSMQVMTMTQKDDIGTVRVRYSLGTERVVETYSVRKAGKEGLFFDVWEMREVTLPTVRIAAPAGAGTVTVEGKDVTAALEGDELTQEMTGELTVLPGIYSADYSDPSGFFDSMTAEAQATEVGTTLDLDADVSEATLSRVRDQVDANVRSRMEACVASNFRGETCPTGAVDLANQVEAERYVTRRFEVTEYPNVSVDYLMGSWTYRALGGSISWVGINKNTNEDMPISESFSEIGTLTVDEGLAVTAINPLTSGT